MVGARGFEPPASWSRTTRSSQAEPRPDGVYFSITKRGALGTAPPGTPRSLRRNEFASARRPGSRPLIAAVQGRFPSAESGNHGVMGGVGLQRTDGDQPLADRADVRHLVGHPV